MDRRFSFFRAPAASVMPYKDITLLDVYRYIVGSYAKERTDEYRQLLHKVSVTLCSSPEGAEMKKVCATYKRTRFDYVCFSGTFTRRTDANMVAHSGYLCLDFDHLEGLVNDGSTLRGQTHVLSPMGRTLEGQTPTCSSVIRTLLDDPCFETMLLFTSPSGNGLKWVIEIDTERASHRQWFEAVSRYLKATYGLEVDRACVNESRACFLPHDPKCYIAPRLLKPLSLPDGHPLPYGGKGVILESMWSENLVDLMEKLGAVEIETRYEK